VAALPPAGVSLEAQGFQDYIRKLDAINKRQRDVFDTEFKGTDKSFAEVTRAAKQYENELKQLNNTQKKAAQEARKLAAAQQTARAAQQQAFISAGQTVIGFAQQVGQTVIESGKLAASFKVQQASLKNLAASFGQSGSQIQAAIQTASKGSLSGLEAISAANEALLLGVAKTPEEFTKFTRAALVLGRTVGLTAEQSITRFTTALGRESLLRLDDFGSKAAEVNDEVKRLAQAELGKLPEQLSKAEKSAIFVEAALNVAGKNVDKLGDSAGEALLIFQQLEATSKNLKITFGEAIRPLGVGISEALNRAFKTAQQFFAFLGAGFTGVGTIATGVFGNIISFFKGEATRTLDDILDEAGRLAIDRFKDIASTIEGVSFDNEIVQDLQNQNDELQEAEQNLKAYEAALKQAEQLQLSFAREAEDTAIKLARANEDIARKQAQSVAKLQERQTKDRNKLLKNQAKQLDKFEASRRKQIAKAESDIAKERREAADQRKRDQQKLQRELAQAQERFNLSQLQSERRFSLSERRLRAEGDILALQQLREDRELERQEEKENFDLNKKEQISSASERQREQTKELKSRVDELKTGLEEQRAELLASFDEQLIAQQEAQAEARTDQQRNFAEQAAERAIQLQREEEDRRRSQARQLEDLGRSLADQQGVTAEGTEAIAGELEKVFGMEGVADNIFKGFTERTESEFKGLFEELGSIVSDAEDKIQTPAIVPLALGGGGLGSRIGGIPEFDNGGVVGGPGPIGSPQIVQAHKGETFIPTHQQSFTMAAPVIPSQSLDVSMSGGFNITGDGQANDEILQAASQEMTENFKIAIRRLARRN
jgi:hypothetical protein